MRSKKQTKGQPGLNLPLDIAITGIKTGLDIAAKAQKAGGSNDAPENMFANLLALAAQVAGKLENKSTASGSPVQTGENWLKAQLGDVKLTIDGKFTIDGKTIDAKQLLAQLLGGAEKLNILSKNAISGAIGAGAGTGTVLQSKILQSSGAYQAMIKASASLSSALNALPGTTASLPTGQAPSTQALAAQLSKAQLAQLALPATAAPENKPETAQQPAGNSTTSLAQNQTATKVIKALLAGNQATQTAQAVSQLSPADTLAAQIQSQFSSSINSKTTTKAKTALASQTGIPTQPGSTTPNPALTPFQILAAKAAQAKADAANNPGTDPVKPGDADTGTDTKVLQSATNLNQTSLAKAQVNVFRPLQAGFQANQINLPNMAFEIVRNLNGGNNRFQIRLDPPELGRIDVRLEVKKDGSTNARLTVDRPDTLDLLQRDARALQRALVQAGLNSSQTSLEFSLKQNPFAGNGFNNGDNNQQSINPTSADEGRASPPPDQAISAYRGYISPGGVSMWV